jgi:hypothetical protein
MAASSAAMPMLTLARTRRPQGRGHGTKQIVEPLLIHGVRSLG